jgi:hypothetical protein
MKAVSGNPDFRHVSTSFVERQNWTVRTTMRRYTRLSNGFSRKLRNHAAATAPKLFRLQLHQDSSYTSHQSGDGGRRYRSALERGGFGSPLGILRAAEGGKSSVMIDDEKRVSGLLEMARQHMQRFRELEVIAWRINFSVWALIGGLAYLWVNGHMTPPPWLMRPCAPLVVPMPAMVLHFVVLFMLNRQEQTEAKLRNHYRDQAEELLGKAIDKSKFRHVGGIRLRDFVWIGWCLIVTFILAASVLFLMQTATPMVPK